MKKDHTLQFVLGALLIQGMAWMTGAPTQNKIGVKTVVGGGMAALFLSFIDGVAPEIANGLAFMLFLGVALDNGEALLTKMGFSKNGVNPTVQSAPAEINPNTGNGLDSQGNVIQRDAYVKNAGNTQSTDSDQNYPIDLSIPDDTSTSNAVNTAPGPATSGGTQQTETAALQTANTLIQQAPSILSEAVQFI